MEHLQKPLPSYKPLKSGWLQNKRDMKLLSVKTLQKLPINSVDHADHFA
jgi:hypothetical protein